MGVKVMAFPWYSRCWALLRDLCFPEVPAHILRGRRGEAFAARFLRERGFKVLARNVRFGRDEIDIVARERDGTLVFVEVKTRSERDVRGGYAAVDARKRAALLRAIRIYLRLARWTRKAWRLDMIEVLVSEHEGKETMTARQISGISPYWKK